MTLKIEAVHKAFGPIRALRGAALEIREGEFMALLGPSGSGKTTLLRVLAGLETPDGGRVLWDTQDFLAARPRDRGVGLVFQQYALFRHMTVAGNIAFGLEVRAARQRPPRREIARRVEALIALTRIEGLGGRYPSQLSGGQKQRVALARALAVEPRLLLLDEPFGALDSKVRKELRAELRRIHDGAGVTTLFVTHDQEEAVALADRVALMNAGQIVQAGSPRELESDPASPFVFEFLGECNRLPCRLAAGIAHFESFRAPAVAAGAPDGLGFGLFRPWETRLDAGPESAGLPVRIASIGGRGALARLECVALDGARLAAEAPRDQAAIFEVGAHVRLTASRAVFDAARSAQ